jgi:hypothetical protein
LRSRQASPSDFRACGAPVIAALLLAVIPPGVALGKGYLPGFYAGHTSQGKPISFLAAGGQVSGLQTEIVDSCHPGSLSEFLHPYAARVDAHGNWSHRAAAVRSQPTSYHGHLDGSSASGAIDDITDARNGRRCHGQIRFRASRSSPLRVGSATVGGRGTDVHLRLAVPAALNGSELVPNTDLALLVYGSNTGCPNTYQAADALARSQSGGHSGLISDAYVLADYGFALSKGYAHGSFTFDVTSNTVLPTASGSSPFSTLCAMLYSGHPGTLTPSRNTAVETTHGRLVPGRGIPNNQP